MKVTPQAIQELFDELEASRQARRRAWEVLQRLRAILVKCGRVRIATPEKKMFETEGALLEKAITKCINDRAAVLKRLADAARRVDKAAFGDQGNFGPAHQALLKVLDEAAEYMDPQCARCVYRCTDPKLCNLATSSFWILSFRP
jgi:hypothetical protein